MNDINVLNRTQRIIVNIASSSVSVINAGPIGPPASVTFMAGGNAGEVLTKVSGDDWDVIWTDPSDSTSPPGGLTSEVLTKLSDSDHDVAWVLPPSLVLLAGGLTSEILVKDSDSDYDFSWQPPLPALPPGGSENAVLTKASPSSYDVIWATPATPINPIPAGGAMNEFLRKIDGTDHNVGWAYAVPVGGTTGQVLRKNSNTNHDLGWVTPAVIPTTVSDWVEIVLSDNTTTITSIGIKGEFRAPYLMTLTGIRASLMTPASVGTFTVDVEEAGVSILSTKLTFNAGSKTTVGASVPAVISDSSLADDAVLTFRVTDKADNLAIGLKVRLYYTRAA